MRLMKRAAFPRKEASIGALCVAITLAACSLRDDSPDIEPTRTLAPRPRATFTAVPESTAASQHLPTTTALAVVQRSADRALSLQRCADLKPALSARTPALGGDGAVFYLTPEGDIAISDIAGKAQVALTNDSFIDRQKQMLRNYQFPVPSPDGAQMAFVRLDIGAGVLTQTVAVLGTQSGGPARELFATNEFNIPYLDWSPDGKTVAFLTINQSGGAIRTVDRAGGDVREVGNGSPTYWHWRHDSSGMLTHLGGRARSASDQARIRLLEMNGAERATNTALDVLPGQFQSPQFSPDGKHMAYVGNIDNGTDALVLGDASGNALCVLATLEAGAFFAWSPDGVRIAFLDTAQPVSQPADLRVIDARDGSEIVLRENISAFFWAPDGEKLAVYSIVRDGVPTQLGSAGSAKGARPAGQSGQNAPLLRIEAVSTDGTAAIDVARTNPTQEFGQYLGFFDQYSRSLSPWSPNAQYLTFSGGESLNTTAEIGVAKIDLARAAVTLTRIADGGLAFFIGK
jgi:Tol biopolymer transport system component